MPTAAEAAGVPPGIAAVLQAGVDLISASGTVTFTLYSRIVIPSDGFVFYIATSQTFDADGSFHYSTQTTQGESETEGVSTVVFTAENPIQMFNRLQPTDLWVGTMDGDDSKADGPIQFAFSSRGRYYENANLYHYVGTALTPVFKAQLLTDSSQLANLEPFVSNSLPIWLSLSNYSPPYASGISNSIPLLPSYVVPENQPPPYIAVHVESSNTQSLQAAPFLSLTTSQNQEAMDEVCCTLYGLNNAQAQTFLAAVLQFSMDYCTLGVNNIPTIRDEKRGSPEFNILALKKTINFTVAYQQGTAREIAKAQIKKVINQYWPQPLSSARFGPPAP